MIHSIGSEIFKKYLDCLKYPRAIKKLKMRICKINPSLELTKDY